MLDELRAHHRQRNFAMEQRKRADLAMGSFVRSTLGWSKDLPDAERNAINTRAKKLITGDEADPLYPVLGAVLESHAQAKAPMELVEKTNTKAMEKLAEKHPVWKAFGEPISGFGVRSFAVILAEAGDLSNYPTVAKLWVRMGLGCMDGNRQGNPGPGATSEDWIAHKYSPRRRSAMFVIGDTMLKKRSTYRDLYDERKIYEQEKARAAGLTIAPAAKIPAKRKHEFISEGVIHLRSKRYMEKRLLRDLWVAWRNHG